MSSLPNGLTVTGDTIATTSSGLLCCLLLVCHAQDTDTVDCDAEKAKCPQLNRVLSPDDLDTLCSSQADRRSCFDALPAECQTSDLSDSLDAVDYICQPAIVDLLKPELTNCVMPNQESIDNYYDSCIDVRATNDTGTCALDIARKCAIEGYNSCCPSLCMYQDMYIYIFYKSVPLTHGCPWPRVSGLCNRQRKECGSLAQPEEPSDRKLYRI